MPVLVICRFLSLFIIIEPNKRNEGDNSTQTYQFLHGPTNESDNYGEVIGPGDYLQITGDVWTVNKMLLTLSYRSPPNGNGYDFITLSARDNGNSGIGFTYETITFVLEVNIVPRNDPPIISLWEVGVVWSPCQKM